MGSPIQSILNVGSDGLVIQTECHLSNSLPGIVVVGLGGKAVDEAKERIRGAFANSSLTMPTKKITINLAPADIPKEGSSLDFAIAAAIICKNEGIKEKLGLKDAIIGELGLDGAIRPVRGIIGKLLIGKSKGIERFFIPAANLQQAQLIPDIHLVPVKTLTEFYAGMSGHNPFTSFSTDKVMDISQSKTADAITINDIVGQEHAKRAITIAAAGGHNILLNGPPGTGKSMLAKSLISLLPALTQDEMLEITHLHSLCSNNFDQLITLRPLRAPHHSASHTAIVGGGHNLKPGEISLSHRGVLFFDEFPEFSRVTIEALRQPLEDRNITISRIKDSTTYPADFIFVATANPCPCGYYGTDKPCHCSPHQILHYRQKISGPIIDRIDLYVTVDQVEYSKLLKKPGQEGTELSDILKRINLAREKQTARFDSATKLNASMTNNELNHTAHINERAKNLLDSAAAKMHISARSYMRVIKVARTIADLEDSLSIEESHIAEALQYRKPNYDTIS